ncbi:uncharacterized protein Dwil_GK18272 [Drosophila willistoni]|uniref:Uncharacterized protein n=1 Tax=Drosophila willistoni TaxID=7260 RepID=B4MZB6_DROWI|nr:uncharacterized protein LOC6643720 [Drosophila willistoni]EDW77389.2 uncharacterized protein Dwil_GK18272 [Drosophila willistoni]
MGAEQSALLACTQTGIPEIPLSLPNSELFFRLYFEKMSKPETGPITTALLHLIEHVDFRGPQMVAPEPASDVDSGVENDDLERASSELLNNRHEWDDDSDVSVGSVTTNLSSDVDDLESLIWRPLEPMETYETDEEIVNEMNEDYHQPLPYFDHFVEEEE